MSLRVLIACETSGIARRAFAAQALQRPLPDGSLGVE